MMWKLKYRHQTGVKKQGSTLRRFSSTTDAVLAHENVVIGYVGKKVIGSQVSTKLVH